MPVQLYFAAAQYEQCQLGRLKSGERVLIYAVEGAVS